MCHHHPHRVELCTLRHYGVNVTPDTLKGLYMRGVSFLKDLVRDGSLLSRTDVVDITPEWSNEVERLPRISTLAKLSPAHTEE